MFGLHMGSMGGRSGRSLAAQIKALYAAGEQGAWYEPLLTNGTLFQDSAGTTPVTAVGQPEGRMLDKSGRGNHAIQPTAINCPVLSALLNRFISTEDLTGSGWNLAGATSRTTATASLTVYGDALYQVCFGAFSAPVGHPFVVSVELSGVGVVSLAALSGTGGDIYTQNVTLTPSPVRYTIPAINDAAGVNTGLLVRGTGSAATVTASKAQYVHGAVATRYQRANTPSDYDAVGFPFFGDYNGANSSTASATGGGNAGFFLCQAIKPKGGAGAARTIWSDAGTYTGYRVRINTANQLELSAGNGTAYTSIATIATLPVGETHLITVLDDGANLNVQIDSGAVASVVRPVVAAGTAGFAVGADNGTAANWFTGNLYAEVYRQTAPNAAQIASVQRYIKQKAGL